MIDAFLGNAVTRSFACATSLEAGLSQTEADRRLTRLGPNKLDEKPGPTLLAVGYRLLLEWTAELAEDVTEQE